MKKKTILIISIISIIISLGFLLYPSASDFINQICNDSLVENYNNNVNTMSDDEIYKEFAAAYEYNDNMANQITTDNKYSYDSTGAYVNILNFDDGQIGYVEIPKIKVSLPIYHGVNEKVLEKGAAHLPNTSFPLDGKSVHSVISAHTAYPAKVFFDNIDKLETGDVFYITILNKKLKYEVCKKNIVDPKDTSLLNIEKDKNLVTLMTCYPYAVNTHRLLVTGELIDIQVKKNSNTISRTETSHNYGLMICILIVLVCLIVIFTILIIKMKRKKRNG